MLGLSRTELHTEIRDLRTELHTEVGGLRTEIGGLHTEVGVVDKKIDDVKRHVSVVAKSLRTDIRTIAEGFVATNERIDRMESTFREEFTEVKAMLRLSFGDLDRRIRSLEG